MSAYYATGVSRYPRVAAPVPPTQSARLWFRHHAGDAHGASLDALAAIVGGPHAGHVALATVVRLRDLCVTVPALRDGCVARVPSVDLAAAVAWPGDPATFVADLEGAGVTVRGHLAGWGQAFALAASSRPVTGTVTLNAVDVTRGRPRTAPGVPGETVEARRRRLAAIRARRYRARHAVTQSAGSVTQTVTLNRPERHAISVTPDLVAVTPVEREKYTHAVALATGSPHATVTVAGGGPVPAAVEVVRAVLAFDPSPPAVVAIVEAVGDAPADLSAWRDACRQWARGRTADGRPWAVGDGGVGALLDRFRQVRARRASTPPVSAAAPVMSSPGTPPPTPVAPRVERSPEDWARNDAARAKAREAFRTARPVVTAAPARPVPARPVPIASPPVAGRVPVPLAGTRTAAPERLGDVLAAMWQGRR